MKAFSYLAAAAACLALSAPVHAGGDVEAGKAKAARCAGCHGANGEGSSSNPKLAGKPESDLAQALADYKSGKRKHGAMNAFAKKLSEADIADLAAYYASLGK